MNNKSTTRSGTPSTKLRVVVDRSRWLRGGGSGAKLLQPRTGHMCLIGHIAAQAGLIKQIPGVNYLASVLDQIRKNRTDVSLHPALAEFTGEAGADLNGRTATLGDGVDADTLPSEIEPPTSVVDALYVYNDSEQIEDPAREQTLSRLCRKIGIELSFNGEALPPYAAGTSRLERSTSQGTMLEATALSRHRLDEGVWKPRPNAADAASSPKEATRTIGSGTAKEITTRARHQLWLHANANPYAAVRIRIYDREGAVLIDEYSEPRFAI